MSGRAIIIVYKSQQSPGLSLNHEFILRLQLYKHNETVTEITLNSNSEVEVFKMLTEETIDTALDLSLRNTLCHTL